MTFAAVLFDLDGTLLDTAPDLIAATNAARGLRGEPPLATALLRPLVSDGSIALSKLGCDFAPDSDEFEHFRRDLLNHYAANVASLTMLFSGMEAILEMLEARQVPWGIVTNKPTYLTTPLLMALEMDRRAGVVVSGDTLTQSKPHPAPLLHAAAELKVEPQQCVYVGDAARDIEAGIAAGMTTVFARYGYVEANEQAERWGANAIVDSPQALLPILFPG